MNAAGARGLTRTEAQQRRATPLGFQIRASRAQVSSERGLSFRLAGIWSVAGVPGPAQRRIPRMEAAGFIQREGRCWAERPLLASLSSCASSFSSQARSLSKAELSAVVLG